MKGWKLKLFFAWYDLWIGAYIDRRGKSVYLCLIPMIVLKFQWGECTVFVEVDIPNDISLDQIKVRYPGRTEP